jgi:TetR/AcrR family transcriptional regulator, cholesterol catabolism regulator
LDASSYRPVDAHRRSLNKNMSSGSALSAVKPKRKGGATKQAPRAGNRQQDLLDAAALLFAQRGYEGMSMRELATKVGMLHGSIYYHFPSKDDLFLTVYEEANRRSKENFAKVLEGITDPWERLEAACIGHVEAILQENHYALVVRQLVMPQNEELRRRIIELRDKHEDLFRKLIDDLPLPGGVNRKYLRLALLGALSHTQVWYKAGGDTPKTIARRFLRLFGLPDDGKK